MGSIFSKGFGGSTLAARAALLGAAMAAFSTLHHAASATTIIYQDSFSGSSTAGTLNGAAPTIDNGTSATWTADSVWSDSGYADPPNQGSRLNAYLSFTPSNGHIYDLSAGLNLPSVGNTVGYPDSSYWVALGFITTPSTTLAYDTSGASPWVTNRYNAAGGAAASGPGNGGYQAFTNTTGVNTLSIVLNTTPSAWTYQVYETNSSVTNLLVASGTFSSNPAITAVGIEDGMGNAKVSNFSLTEVPEPFSLSLLATGGLGLLLRRRGRTS